MQALLLRHGLDLGCSFCFTAILAKARTAATLSVPLPVV